MTAERRVRRGGRMAMHDLTQGPSPGSLDMPVPEADTEDEIFLAETESLKTLLAASGFREILWRDRTQATIEFFEKLPDPGPLSLQLVLGENYREMFGKSLRSAFGTRARNRHYLLFRAEGLSVIAPASIRPIVALPS